MKHFAKKSEVVAAIQWTGEMTPDVQAFLQGRAEHSSVSEGRLHFAGGRGPGRAADRGDWIVWSSEGLVPVGDADIKRLYNEVDGNGRPALDAAAHEAASHEFVQELDAILVEGLRLSQEQHPKIFMRRDKLVRVLWRLMEDHGWNAEQRERERLKKHLIKELA
ncbi:MAG TPA: hypothetical protein VLE97_08815 [Gaiellaceae bacterium]|nr:hypothetical protein [Gaiellaceae bacterium]